MPGSGARTAAATDPLSSPPGTVDHRPEHSAGWILRFDGVERICHWATAALFAILMATALPLYFVQFESLVGRRALVADIHTWAGVALPVPLILSLVGPWGAGLRRDLRRVNLWTAAELRWLRTLGRLRLGAPDKFNPGQKLNTLFTGGAIVVMLATGFILKWYRFFPLTWRTGATFVHDVLALGIFLVVTGHIAFGLTHREALRSMLWGRVSAAWARRHASGWLAEEQAAADASHLAEQPDPTD